MKKLSFLALAAAGLMMVGCSDKDVVVQDVNNNAWNGEGDGYMAVNINLPTTPAATRAANDVFDDGLANEYNVQDAALLLFTGETEAAATLMSAQPLTLPFPVTDEDHSDIPADNITTSYQAVAKVSGQVNGKLFALVVLNYKNVLTIASGTAKIVDGDEDATNDVTVTTLASIQSSSDNIFAGNSKFTNKGTNTTANYFFMTNALLQNLETGTNDHKDTEPTKTTAAPLATNIQTLALVDQTKIFHTEAEAKAAPAADIYVERAVAKATLTYTATQIEGSDAPLEISGVEWAIDNIEPASFIVRNPGENEYIAYSSEAFGTNYVYRFVGNAAMGKTATLHNYYTPIYRHYWAVDPVYDKNYLDRTDDALLAAEKYVSTAVPLYCNENTFNVANQTYGNTTRAIIKVSTKDNKTFYTVNGGQTRYEEAPAKSYIVTDLVENSSFQGKIRGCLLEDHSYNFSAATVVPEWDVDENAQVYIKSITLGTNITAADFDMDAIGNLDFSEEIAAANANFVVLKYSDGVVYYEARFQHFANTYFEAGNGTNTAPLATAAEAAGDLAPWNFWEPENETVDGNLVVYKPSATVAYPAGKTKTAEENYLGRWGMVRNNWYDVTIGAFKKLGSPVDPKGKIDKPSTPDDNLEDYISVKIHVLSWAKRTQTWTF